MRTEELAAPSESSSSAGAEGVPPERIAYAACRKQTITMVKETISGVPFTGRPNPTRPITSAHTRKLRQNVNSAAMASSTWTRRALMRSNIQRNSR